MFANRMCGFFSCVLLSGDSGKPVEWIQEKSKHSKENKSFTPY